MATDSSSPAWVIPWTEVPGRLQSMGLQRIRHSLVTKQQQQWPDSWLPPERETPENTRKSLIRFQKWVPKFSSPSRGWEPRSDFQGKGIKNLWTYFSLFHWGLVGSCFISRQWKCGVITTGVCVRAQLLQSCPIFVTLWAIAFQASLFVGFSRQEYWSGFPFPSPGDLPDPGIEPAFPVSPALASRFFTTEPPGKPP